MNSRLVVTVVVVLAVLAVGLVRRARSRSAAGAQAASGSSLFSREVKVNRLWIMPAAVAVFCTGLIAFGTAPAPAALAVWAAALAIGGGLGWLRGKSMRIEVHPETAEVRSHVGGAAVIVILGFVLMRGGLRYWLVQNPTALPVDATKLTDAFLVMAVGVVAGQRLEMWLRARRLLAERTARLAETFN